MALVIRSTFLPVLLTGTFHAWTVPTMALLSSMVLGIENMGVQIEEPLSILPLSTICSRLEEGILSLHSESEQIKLIASMKSEIEGYGLAKEGISGTQERRTVPGGSGIAPLEFANLARVVDEADNIPFRADLQCSSKGVSDHNE